MFDLTFSPLPAGGCLLPGSCNVCHVDDIIYLIVYFRFSYSGVIRCYEIVQTVTTHRTVKLHMTWNEFNNAHKTCKYSVTLY